MANEPLATMRPPSGGDGGVLAGLRADVAAAYHPDGVPPLVAAAFDFAAAAHAPQRRRSGEPYIVHPAAAAVELARHGADDATVAAGLCHDVLEDCGVSREEMAAALGEEVTTLVEGVTRIGQIRDRTRRGAADAQGAANLARLVGCIAGDVRVLLIKLADRLHNMRTLHHLPAEKRARIARETLDIFAPLAHRAGVDDWAGELEDLAFRYADPDAWTELEVELARVAPDRELLEREATATLASALAAGGVDATLSSRTKGRWSLWRKLRADGRTVVEVADLVGVRVVVGSLADCYTALGVAHGTFLPVPGGFKDYVALPKPNGYQSLHTKVVDASGRRFEVQIRTIQMDQVARFGTAAHHRYKNPAAVVATDPALDPESFLEELRAELSQQADVLVLTPRGDVVTLPAGSCAIDFAYAVHTEVGHRCSGARVNGALRPIRAPLHTGDTVEVLTRPDGRPSRDWLDSVRTPHARNRIRRFFAETDRATNERLGREAVDRALAARQVPAGRQREEAAARAAAHLGFGGTADLYRRVGEGSVQTRRVTAAVVSPGSAAEPPAPAPATSVGAPELAGLRFQVAQCCLPDGEADLVGYVTVGRGVTVHRADCRNLAALVASLDAAGRGRVLPLSTGFGAGYAVAVEAADRPGLLAEVTGVLAAHGVGIRSSETATDRRLGVVERFVCDPPADPDALRAALLAVPGVRRVQLQPSGRVPTGRRPRRRRRA
jgi:GTP pyrophosphokinase